MRILEMALILVNVMSLLLCFSKLPRKVWISTASVNLAVLLLHGLVEGFRYQMFLAYAFVLLLIIYTVFKTTTRLPKVLKGLVMCLSAGSLALTSFLSYALPVFTLPKLTGDYKIGVEELRLVDNNRDDPFLDKSPQPRELMIKLYYPAEKNNSKPNEPYLQPELITLFALFFHVPEFALEYLRLVKTAAKADLPISSRLSQYPVVLFSHGAGTSMAVHTSQYEDLASHGYIVAAIDHTYVSAGTVFPDHAVSAMEATTDFHIAEPAEIITQIMADDASFVMDKLSELNEGKEMQDVDFKGKLDLDHIGVMGHSVGGAAAYNLAMHDSRVKAAVNLDGAVYVTPENDKAMAPFLMLANDKNHIQQIKDRKPLIQDLNEVAAEEQEQLISESVYGTREAYEAAYNKARQNITGLTDMLEASGSLYTIKGSDHMKFTDFGLLIGSNWLRNKIGIGGKTDPARCLIITEALTRAFFDQHLKGATSDPSNALLQEYPELEKVTL
ncbi:dienelactone hydrolase family protein [Paenibacillus glycanilyticus]|uniref:alpha/beta hydrolase family protein n=1 Tax=Paenibacillus glycanilyticus TaxID=126569 RepID=UPI00203ED2A6|nr:dienelactone hydrolase family protein [Paenibacillus glycanilyticus]MCM3627773.1 dienelactone hydrolase family protein [Paenibacillus glycanilyticus]